MSAFPDIPYRTKEEIIADFRKHAEDCEHRTNPEDIHDRFEQALKLMLDARLPRADDDDELRGMLEQGMRDIDEGKSLSSEEVFKQLEERRVGFREYLDRFRALLALEAWEQAAMMLAPCEGRSGPGYYGGHSGDYYRLTMHTHGYDNGKFMGYGGCRIEHPLSSGGGPEVRAYAPTPGLSMLAAIMKAHAEWHELWKR